MAFHFNAKGGVIGALLLAAGCMSGQSSGASPELVGGDGSGSGSGTSVAVSDQVSVTTLASDQSNLAGNLDTSLVNAWGVVAFQGWFWVADNATGKLSVFDGAGHPAAIVKDGTGNGGGMGTGTGQSGQGGGTDQTGAGQGSGTDQSGAGQGN